ncbi:uncharacterized protein PGTG_06976 [Puccinia graminis f. sp. tritici CRL 75-36-700-3]|uniref:Uncharacterized protein n=1 Tax=Puccinia graminis f. sp. tritici (strain CRL 75-36-700-3 / race SCCL) TaxID=418459 RepID=E3KAW5_PUCGT|nr:uncharacterized protein PGTG_06976 [Puccinia graminis f. sp. tritici CRL 75-36-700-3]EFP81355.2 hypothetical protein PGTG_06976 [Puccinia graminis f. sp. tritici CRL 75-36-700-3]
MIELLGLHEQSELIPLLLSWMKTIGVKPNQDLLIRAYNYWIYKSSAITHRLAGLDEFVKNWICEIESYAIHNDEEESGEEEEGEDLVKHQQGDDGDTGTDRYVNRHPEKNRTKKLRKNMTCSALFRSTVHK